jgi:hypothetical protein
LPAPPGPSPTIPLMVTLRIRDDRGNTATATDTGARVLPLHLCGY